MKEYEKSIGSDDATRVLYHTMGKGKIPENTYEAEESRVAR